MGVKLKRFAGASAGSLLAALLAIGYSSAEITEIMSQDLQAIFLGNPLTSKHSCCAISETAVITEVGSHTLLLVGDRCNRCPIAMLFLGFQVAIQ